MLLSKLCLTLFGGFSLKEELQCSPCSETSSVSTAQTGLFNYSSVTALFNFKEGHLFIPQMFNMKTQVTWEQGVPPVALFNKELVSLPYTTTGRKRDSRLAARPSELAECAKQAQRAWKSGCRQRNSSRETRASTVGVQLIIQKHLTEAYERGPAD